MSCGRRFPVQGGYTGERDNRGAVIYVPDSDMDWHEAESVYEDYAFLYPSSARGQSLERLAQRGGWGWNEADYLRKEAAAKRWLDRDHYIR